MTSNRISAIGTRFVRRYTTSGRKIFERKSATTNGKSTGCMMAYCNASPPTTRASVARGKVIERGTDIVTKIQLLRYFVLESSFFIRNYSFSAWNDTPYEKVNYLVMKRAVFSIFGIVAILVLLTQGCGEHFKCRSDRFSSVGCELFAAGRAVSYARL